MADLRPQHQRWKILLKFLIAVTASIWLFFMYTVVHYDDISPTSVNEASGHIYPRYDKIHGRYVYLDKTAKDCEFNFEVVLRVFGICGIVVGLKISSLLAKSKGGVAEDADHRGASEQE